MHAGTSGLRRSRASNSLIAMQTMHPELWAVHFPDVLRAVMGSILSEADLAVAARFFVYPKGLGAWELLSKVEKLRVCNFVRNAPVPMLEDLDDFFDLPNTHEIYKSALARIRAASFDELKAVAWSLFVPDEVFKEILKFYERSESFAVANEMGKYIRGQLGDVLGLKGFLDSIIQIAAKNDQVKFSSELVNLLRAFASDKSIGLDYVGSEVSNHKLTVDGL
ncbi:hypothetical protein [Pseudomonas sp. PS01301]|uniref:hypothetical protein n=1 Tax=Pseudomonas sp. PS01301 TaxID=2991437 RepID=UPI00249B6162|nr:hypothetical protein [Pseudomonas sp. PS01301]